MAMFVAMSVMLSPAHAVAMIDCDVQRALHAMGDLELHGVHAEDNTASAGRESHDLSHSLNHCLSHVCVVAVVAISGEPSVPQLLRADVFGEYRVSLVSGADPNGPRRPPRV
ncbi:hypothetical protein LCL97_11305 [Seohaeicola saemankumensis]|nr:hypothetical protein [Seohaeicola saemankumensis]MCA0871415.1 hypothetical protein [Seohaeicola saemankumensis]